MTEEQKCNLVKVLIWQIYLAKKKNNLCTLCTNWYVLVFHHK